METCCGKALFSLSQSAVPIILLPHYLGVGVMTVWRYEHGYTDERGKYHPPLEGFPKPSMAFGHKRWRKGRSSRVLQLASGSQQRGKVLDWTKGAEDERCDGFSLTFSLAGTRLRGAIPNRPHGGQVLLD